MSSPHTSDSDTSSAPSRQQLVNVVSWSVVLLLMALGALLSYHTLDELVFSNPQETSNAKLGVLLVWFGAIALFALSAFAIYLFGPVAPPLGPTILILIFWFWFPSLIFDLAPAALEWLFTTIASTYESLADAIFE